MAKIQKTNNKKFSTGGAKPNSMAALERNLPASGGNNAPSGNGMVMNNSAKNEMGKKYLPQ